jgi:hypothetical protein
VERVPYLVQLHTSIFIFEVDSSSAGQEIPILLWNPEIHYRVHKIPLLDPVLS